MDRSYHRLWRENRGGLAGSLLLHGVFLALWLFWSLAHPPIPRPALKAMLVDLVATPAIAPAPSGGAPAVQRPIPATAPQRLGERPHAVTPPPDAMEARIAALANLRQPSGALPMPDNDGAAAGTGSGGGYALADYVRAQILRKWWPDLADNAARGMPVALTLIMSATGALSDIRIVDQARFASDPRFRDMALSARNAALNASPIALPPGHYDARTRIAVTLDPKAVLH